MLDAVPHGLMVHEVKLVLVADVVAGSLRRLGDGLAARTLVRTTTNVGTVRLDFGTSMGGSNASQFSSGSSLSGSSYSLDCAVQQGESLRSYRWDE
jgi:hypothetical protein